MKVLFFSLFFTIITFQLLYAQKLPKKVNYDDLELRKLPSDSNLIAYLKDSNKPFSGIACNYYFPHDSIEMDETTYINGKSIGAWETFYEDGKLHEKGANNENGEKDGKYYEYYETGITECEGEYKDGLKTQAWLYYYDNGVFYYGGEYILDKKWGIWHYHDHKGNEIKRITYDMDVITNIETEQPDSTR